MKILGKRNDGVLLVDIGSKTAYAVDLTTSRYANLGDVMSREATSPEWVDVGRPAADAGTRAAIQRVLDRGQRVMLANVHPTPPDRIEQEKVDEDNEQRKEDTEDPEDSHDDEGEGVPGPTVSHRRDLAAAIASGFDHAVHLKTGKDAPEHPFQYCMEHVVPQMPEKPDDPEAFCAWWKNEHYPESK